MEFQPLPNTAEPFSTASRLGSVVLCLGSNLGDRVRNIERALDRLIMHIHLERVSEIYESEPVERRDQPWFLNLVCMGTTTLRPWDLLEFILKVEDDIGRKRGERHAPRTIDVDILTYDDQIMEEPDLWIPHPRMLERAFVLTPLAEIAPEWRHPLSGETAEGALAKLEGQLIRPYSAPPPLRPPGASIL